MWGVRGKAGRQLAAARRVYGVAGAGAVGGSSSEKNKNSAAAFAIALSVYRKMRLN